MFAEIGIDQIIMYPGALVTSADKARAVRVYPLALVHFSLYPAEAHAIFIAIVDALSPQKPEATPIGDAEPKDALELATVAITRLMLSTGFPLLQACTVPPIESPIDDLAGPVVASWISQSINPDYFDADKTKYIGSANPKQPDEMESAPSFRLKLAGLLAGGHKADNIFHTVQTGFDGQPVPFQGWTLRQLEYWSKATDAANARQQAGFATATAMAIGACLGGDAGGDAFRDYTQSLRPLN